VSTHYPPGFEVLLTTDKKVSPIGVLFVPE